MNLFGLFCQLSNGNITDSGPIGARWFNKKNVSWFSYVEFIDQTNFELGYLWDFEIVCDEDGQVLVASIVDTRYSRAFVWVDSQYKNSYEDSVSTIGYDITCIPASISKVDILTEQEIIEKIFEVITLIHGNQSDVVKRIHRFRETHKSEVEQQMRVNASMNGVSVVSLFNTMRYFYPND